jgi:hypothetical protein
MFIKNHHCRGKKHTLETRNKISLSHLGIKPSPETRIKNGLAHLKFKACKICGMSICRRPDGHRNAYCETHWKIKRHLEGYFRYRGYSSKNITNAMILESTKIINLLTKAKEVSNAIRN